MTPKERRKYRERVRPLLALHDLQPIYEMNFRSSYYVLDTTPPSGNIRMSKMFLMKLHQRGVELASARRTTFGGMSVYFRQKIMGVDTDDGNWHSLKNGLTYELEVDYWDADSSALKDTRLITAEPLFEAYNNMFIPQLGLPKNYDIADFLVVRQVIDGNTVWCPMRVVNPMYSASELNLISSW